jgi:hypothetical protein
MTPIQHSRHGSVPLIAALAMLLSAFGAQAYTPPGSDSAVDGVCGSSSGRWTLTTPTANLCSAGSASTVQGTGPWSWTCDGGGIVAVCSADVGTPVDGACGTSNGVNTTTTPAANLCAAGETSLVTDYTMAFKSHPEYWTWSCNGIGGGVVASCKASYGTPVNGTCGSSNGQTLSSAPSSGLCSTGTASAVTGSSPWSWSCTGSGGGTTASCSSAGTTGGTAVQTSGPLTAMTMQASFTPPGNAQGVSGAIYVAAIISGNVFFLSANGTWTPYVAGQSAMAFFTGQLTAMPLAIMPTALDLSGLRGAQILVGYGKGIAPLSDPFNNMLNNATYDVVYTVQ